MGGKVIGLAGKAMCSSSRIKNFSFGSIPVNQDIIALLDLGYNLSATSLDRAYKDGLISWNEMVDLYCTPEAISLDIVRQGR